jgi:hypothetical protein
MKPILSSKWNYVMCGINIMVAALGATFHILWVLGIGAFFVVFNYYVAEMNKEIEDESIRKSVTETKE